MMLFRRKGWLRTDYDQRLLQLVEDLKEDWMNQKEIVERSVEPSPEVIQSLKIAESKYFYMLREAKIRKLSLGMMKK